MTDLQHGQGGRCVCLLRVAEQIERVGSGMRAAAREALEVVLIAAKRMSISQIGEHCNDKATNMGVELRTLLM